MRRLYARGKAQWSWRALSVVKLAHTSCEERLILAFVASCALVRPPPAGAQGATEGRMYAPLGAPFRDPQPTFAPPLSLLSSALPSATRNSLDPHTRRIPARRAAHKTQSSAEEAHASTRNGDGQVEQPETNLAHALGPLAARPAEPHPAVLGLLAVADEEHAVREVGAGERAAVKPELSWGRDGEGGGGGEEGEERGGEGEAHVDAVKR